MGEIWWMGKGPKGSSLSLSLSLSLSPCFLPLRAIVRMAHPLSEDQKQVKGFQGGGTSQAYAVIATGAMNDAVYDSPILIDRSID